MQHNNRASIKTRTEQIIDFLYKYAFLETTIFVLLFCIVGYLLNPEDILLLNSKVPFAIILLSVITLFHGFENGVFALSVLTFAMWYFYPLFPYVDFLILLLMTMIYSQFHYFWSSRIKSAQVEANYKSQKLSELSRAFYTLKISHDQLEKNYIIKPMSIRNSVNYIIQKNQQILHDPAITNKQKEYNKNFIELLEKSFNFHGGFLLYLKDDKSDASFTLPHVEYISLGVDENSIVLEDVFNNPLVDKAIEKKIPIYVSDENAQPSIEHLDEHNRYLAVIPAVIHGNIRSLLVIEKMPFMFFNKENLTAIALLHDYFAIENIKDDALLLLNHPVLSYIQDKDFQFEISRLKNFHEKYKVNSIFLVLRIDNELQSARLFDKLQKMLRSLDMITTVHNAEYFYITILLPLHDKAAALGLLKRLLSTLEDEKDKHFEHMTFTMQQLDLLTKYFREDYGK